MKPTLSVIIPNYNHAQYLSESLEAIFCQTVQPLEVIVVDDASTDASCEVVTHYQQKQPHLSLLRLNPNSGGPTIPIQEGLKIAKGSHLALCASDDIIKPIFFEEALRLIKANPEVGLCVGNFAKFSDSKPYKYDPVSLFDVAKSQIFTPDETVAVCRNNRFFFASQTTIYKKELVLKYGSYNPRLETLADFYLNCQIAFRHPIGYVPKVLGAYRIRNDSYARSSRFEIKRRNHIFDYLMTHLQNEETPFQKRVKHSGILARAGIYMIAYLALHPKYWSYLPQASKKMLIDRC